MKRRAFLKSCAAAALTLTDSRLPASETGTAETLEASFRNPPNSARPKTWWHWMNGNVTADGITRDIEAMHRVGLGGFQIFNVGCRTPKGPVVFFSPEWLELTTHAAQEAERLGLEFGMHNCPGWSSSGGPWISPQLAMQQMVWSETFLEGDRHVEISLPQPYTKLGYYRDAFVLAFPSLAGETKALKDLIAAVTSSSGPVDKNLLTDGDLSKGVQVYPAVSAETAFLEIEFAEPATAQAIAVYAVSLTATGSSTAAPMIVESSQDGTSFERICNLVVPSTGGVSDIPGTQSFAPVRMKYLRLTFHQPTRISQLRLSGAARIPGWHYKNNSASRGGPGQATAPQPRRAVDVPKESVIDVASVIDISSCVDAQGRLSWNAPPGHWTILRFGHTPTGRHNSSAPDGGVGLDCDKFTRAGIDFHFHYMFDRLFPVLGPLAAKSMAGTLIDSFEVGMQNWTSEFPKEFDRRCGYDLRKYMPAMTGRIVGNAEESERFLWDLRRTQADLIAENYYGRFAELCKEHGLQSSAEPYAGGPFDEIQIGSKVQVPMGEFWQGGGSHRSVKLASSVGHVYGKRVIASESFTGNPEFSKWQGHPYGFKAQGDWMYTQGLNRFIFHRYAMQPHPDAVPGMTMGPYGIHLDRTNTWFEHAGPWMEYLSRCQYLLQQGLFVADILYFEGENAPVEAPAVSSLRPPPPPGYDWDAIDRGAILERIRIENERIVLPDGMTYRILVLRDSTRISLNLLRKIRDLVQAGMCLMSAKPEGSPSLVDYPASDAEACHIADEMWADLDGTTKTERTFGKGRIVWTQPLRPVLDKLKVTPDFEVSSRSSDAQIYHIHRHIGETDVYFVANHRRRTEELVCTFRVGAAQPELWDPTTGATAAINLYETGDGWVRIPMHLDPAGSAFVVFRPRKGKQGLSAISQDDSVVLTTSSYPPKSQAPHRDVINNFSISTWIKPELDTPLPATGRRLNAGSSSFVFYPPAGDLIYGSGHVCCGLSAGRNGLSVYERSHEGLLAVLTVPMPLSGWTHVTVTYNDGVPSLYMNGHFIQRGEKSANLVHPGIHEVGFNYGDPTFNGDLTEALLSIQPLTEDGILKLVNAGVPAPDAPPPVEMGATETAEFLFWQNAIYSMHESTGQVRKIRVTAVEDPIELSGPWLVSFPPHRGAPPSITLPKLASLHEHTEPGVRYFSGTATYSKTFPIARRSDGRTKRTYLDLGRVEVLAEVRLNDRPVGKLWKPPFRMDITEFLQPGNNKLEVQVTNLWPNRLIGDEHLPAENEYNEKGTKTKDIGGILHIPDWFLDGQPKPGPRITFSTWRHYTKDSPLLESGLLGPVQLRTAVRGPKDV